MKRLMVLGLIGLMSCGEETVNQPPASSMVLSGEVVTLSSTLPTDSVVARLACGCDFEYAVDRFDGDTNVIKYTTRDVGDLFGNKRSFVFHAEPGAHPGAYQARLFFRIWEPDEPGIYGDTIQVFYSVD